MPPVSDTLSGSALLAALQSCRIFESLNGADLQRVAGFATLQRVAQGEYLFREGEPTTGFYVVRSGAIHVHRIGPDGREKTIHIFRAGGSFAEATLPDGTGYPAHACAVEDGVVVFIPRIQFLDLLRQRPDLSLRMLACMSQHLRELVDAIDDLTRKDVEIRLALWLIKRCPQPLGANPVDVRLETTKTVFASQLHIRKETLSRALARMKSIQLVETNGRVIRVVHPRKLESWVTGLGTEP